jgi:hypothetical protein
MFGDIDTLPDTRSSGQFVKRVRGEPKDQPPPATKTLVGRARRWMIDPKWLQDNPEFDLPKYIADSGRLWGDAVDPEETEALIKQSAKDKADIKLKRKQQISNIGGSDKEGGRERKRGKKGKGKKKDTRQNDEIGEEDDFYD